MGWSWLLRVHGPATDAVSVIHSIGVVCYVLQHHVLIICIQHQTTSVHAPVTKPTLMHTCIMRRWLMASCIAAPQSVHAWVCTACHGECTGTSTSIAHSVHLWLHRGNGAQWMDEQGSALQGTNNNVPTYRNVEQYKHCPTSVAAMQVPNTLCSCRGWHALVCCSSSETDMHGPGTCIFSRFQIACIILLPRCLCTEHLCFCTHKNTDAIPSKGAVRRGGACWW